jgi:hypothetical protein
MREVPLTHRLLECYASSAETPEEALIAAEAEERDERAHRDWRALGVRDVRRLEFAMRDLPRDEAITLGLWYRGVTQREIAGELGVSHGAVWKSVQRATLRLRWLTGPASWFAPGDLLTDLQPTLGAEASELLATWWETTSHAATARRLRLDRRHVHARVLVLVRREVPAFALFAPVARRYCRGFRELQSWGRELLSPRHPCRQGTRQGTAA